MARARIVIFTDRRGYIGRHLTRAFVAAADARDDLEIAAVVDTADAPFGRADAACETVERIVRRAFDRAHPFVARPMFRLGSMLRRRGIAQLAGSTHDVDDPGFVARALPAQDLPFALSLACRCVFGAPLVASFRGIVNYHNGALPAYRGLNATAWSIYLGDASSAFSYHWMTQGLDEGDVVATGAVPIAPEASVAAIEWAKTQCAGAAAPRVLDALVAGEPGVAQRGPAAYRGRAEFRAIVAVGDPRLQRWSDLQARVRAFGRVQLALRGGEIDATRLRRMEGRARRPALAFVTADGVAAEVDRIRFLPPALARFVPGLRER